MAESPEARRERCRRWHSLPGNRERHKASQQQRQRRNWAIIDAARDKPCVDCGVKYPIVAMQLDHVRGTKVAPIARMKTTSVAKLRAELAKCDVRCANCHAIKTWGGQGRHA